MNTANKSVESETKFKYLATVNQNYIDKEITEQIRFGNCLLPFSSESSVRIYMCEKVKINGTAPGVYMGMQHGLSI
jgi:hypothetical protein